jgi:hypothetical protein
VYVCHSEGEWARYDLSAFEQGMVAGARRTALCQVLQRCWVFHDQQFPVCITNGPPTKGYPSTVGSIGVNMGQHPCGTLSTPCRVLAPTNLGYSEGKGGLGVFLMLCTLSV